MEAETAITQVVAQVQPAGGALTMRQITERVNLVHEVLEKVMKKGTHFGTVPGCGAKMVLLKPGADVLAMTFRLVPQFAVTRTELPDGHREFDVTCSMFGPGGELLGQGVGSASTMEKKYRYRKDENGNKIENEDIADVYNTVLKIAKKRAHIDATLTVTGAADLFTQDLIDEDEPPRVPVSQPVEKPKRTAKIDPDTLTVTGLIDSVETQSGEKNGKTWTRYGIHVAGLVIGTFDKALGDDATALGEAGIEAEIAYTDNGKYLTAASVRPIEQPPADI